MAGIAKSKIANVHVEALRRGAFLSIKEKIEKKLILFKSTFIITDSESKLIRSQMTK